MIAEAMSREPGERDPEEGPVSVLLIEDNPGDARLVEQYLGDAQDLPNRLRWTKSLEEGLSALAAGPVDVVLLDLSLPDSDGVDTVRRLTEVADDVPLLVLTGQEDAGTALWALRAGADEYVYKGELSSHVLSRTIRFAVERREMARELTVERKLSRGILSSLQEEIAVLDADGTIISANEAWQRFAREEGGRPDGYVGENYFEVTRRVLDDEHAREALEGLRAVAAGGTSVFTMEYPCHAPDERRWFRLSATPLEGNLGGIVVSHTDISQRRRMEEELRRSEEQLSTVFELSPTGIIVSTPEDGVIQAVNRAALDYQGAEDADELVGRSAVDLGLWVREEVRDRIVEQVRSEGRALNVEAEHWTLDGERKVGLVSARRLALAGEDRIVFVVHDITERKEREAELRRNRDLLEAVVEGTSDGIFVKDRSGEILFTNAAAARLLTGADRDIAGLRDEDVLDAESLDMVRRADREVLASGEIRRFEQTIPSESGDPRTYDVLVAPFLEVDGQPEGVIGFARDITEERIRKAELQETRDFLQSLLGAAPALVFRLRLPDLKPTYAGPTFRELTGHSVEDFTSSTDFWREQVPDEDLPVIVEAVEEGLEKDLPQVATEFRFRHADGQLHWYQVAARFERDEGGQPVSLVGSAIDVTEKKQAFESLRQSEERYRTLFEDAQEAIAITRPDGSIVDVNPMWHELFGHGPADLAGLDVGELYVEPDDRRRIIGALEADGRMEQMELQARRADGSVFDCLISASAHRTEEGDVEFVSFLRDISERKRFEEELQHRALHDVLTGLPNRGLLSDRLEQAVARARREESAVALFFVDVDRFKAVNDSFGHEAGDQILVTLARELERGVRSEDTVARFGGDEFVVLAEGLRGREDAVTTAERLVETLRASSPFSSAPYHLTASVGVAVCGRGVGSCSAEDMLRQADIAMYRAKGTSGTTYHLFDPEVDGEGLGRLQREKELRQALESEEFVPVYQPVMRLETAEPWGVEMLARWDHPERGRVGPGEFIPLAEESGLILTLDRQLLAAGLKDFAAWHAAGGPAPERLLVNLSASQFEDPAFPDFVAAQLEEHDVSPEAVHFEVTETEIMQSTERIRPLAALGVRLLIDDFGTGYSSLGYLRELDVSGLKIDMSFVQGITEDADDRAIVETILTLGDRLGLEVIAEGIETAEQRETLRSMGCPLGQGYLFARPTDEGELLALLEGADVAG